MYMTVWVALMMTSNVSIEMITIIHRNMNTPTMMMIFRVSAAVIKLLFCRTI